MKRIIVCCLITRSEPRRVPYDKNSSTRTCALKIKVMPTVIPSMMVKAEIPTPLPGIEFPPLST